MGIFDLNVPVIEDPGESGQDSAPDLPPAAPCSSCGCCMAWVTVYGEFRCWECFRPPAASLICSRLALHGAVPPYEWTIHPASGWDKDAPPGRAGVAAGGDAGDGEWDEYELRGVRITRRQVRWPPRTVRMDEWFERLPAVPIEEISFDREFYQRHWSPRRK